jgi:hypothetical protein
LPSATTGKNSTWETTMGRRPYDGSLKDERVMKWIWVS